MSMWELVHSLYTVQDATLMPAVDRTRRSHVPNDVSKSCKSEETAHLERVLVVGS